MSPTLQAAMAKALRANWHAERDLIAVGGENIHTVMQADSLRILRFLRSDPETLRVMAEALHELEVDTKRRAGSTPCTRWGDPSHRLRYEQDALVVASRLFGAES